MIFKVLRGFSCGVFSRLPARSTRPTRGPKAGYPEPANADSAAEAGAAEASAAAEGESEAEVESEEVMAAAQETAEERAAAEPAPPPDSFTLFFEPDSWILGTEGPGDHRTMPSPRPR